MPYVLISAEERAKTFPDTFLPDRHKREQLKRGMVARIIFAVADPDARGRQRSERLWVRIGFVATIAGVVYLGHLISESFALDLEPGDPVTFGPEHVLEWDVNA